MSTRTAQTQLIRDRLRFHDERLRELRRSQYKAQSARDAQSSGYGDKSYWDYLEQSAQEHYEYYMGHGDPVTAEQMFTRSLSESLMGNDGD